MTFTPIIPFGGASGWAFLQRTQDAQREAFESSPQIKRDIAYFEENIGSVTSSDDLIGDYRLLKVALGAYGLDGDIGNKYFIKKVLEDGTLDTTDLANKLSDKRYLEFSAGFGFGDFNTPRTQISDFGQKISDAYKERQFEISVGEQNQEMRLALSLERELSAIVTKDSSDETKWYSIMGNAPLRTIFETAFGLPTSFASVDLDQQLTALRDRADQYFGSPEAGQFSDPDKMEELNRLFIVRSELKAGASVMSGNAIALTLLQNL